MFHIRDVIHRLTFAKVLGVTITTGDFLRRAMSSWRCSQTFLSPRVSSKPYSAIIHKGRGGGAVNCASYLCEQSGAEHTPLPLSQRHVLSSLMHVVIPLLHIKICTSKSPPGFLEVVHRHGPHSHPTRQIQRGRGS